MLFGYQPEDVYNTHKSDLFFRAFPHKAFSFKNETCFRGKLSKERGVGNKEDFALCKYGRA